MSKIRKKGRIKKEISEWDAFWEQHPGFIAESTSWHDAVPEVLHIAIALQHHEPDTILRDMLNVRGQINKFYNLDWNGNLSSIFHLFRDVGKKNN